MKGSLKGDPFSFGSSGRAGKIYTDVTDLDTDYTDFLDLGDAPAFPESHRLATPHP
ncbi:hypothetical protein VH569_12330 [Azospirillum sp. 11R-A]|uniref:hypothetical protein n=1 Tax=Azospirillum sp. 11R-A TaxID=3111634 RepID=UPI003C2A37F4